MTSPRGKTKIICTLGPASSSAETLVDLIASGMGIVRLNFSHGTQGQHDEALKNVHRAVERAGVEVSVLQDLQGPKIRIGELSVPSIDLRQGEKLVITTEPLVGGPGRVSTTYEGLSHDVQPGVDILLDDGKLRLKSWRSKGKM